jgi:SAM-dependent methyltransferase
LAVSRPDELGEAGAVAARYARRSPGDLYDPLRPDVLYSLQERQRALAALLARHAARPPAELDVLEVGCGHGGNLLELIRLGFDPARLVGNELLADRALAARRRLPAAVRLIEGDALTMPIPPATFDIVYQSTVFSSLLDAGFQEQLARRMWAWVRPGGGVLWYDFIFNNPANPDVRGVPIARVRQLFPEGRLDARRVTLAPPIARRVTRLHGAAYWLFNMWFLRTHRLCWIGKRA